MRHLVPGVQDELGTLVDRDDVRVGQTLNSAFFRRKLRDDQLHCSVQRIPELHALAGAADDGHLAEAVNILDGGANAANPLPDQWNRRRGVARRVPVEGHGLEPDPGSTEDGSTNEGCLVLTNLRLKKVSSSYSSHFIYDSGQLVSL